MASHRLELAESFYAVGRELRARAQHDIGIAKFLERYADALCEENMRETPPKVPAPPRTVSGGGG